MKLLMAVMVAMTSTFSVAETCFKATKELPVESFLPEVVCVESVNLELINPGLPRTPFYQATAVTSLGTIKKAVIFDEFQTAPFSVSLPIGVHKIGGRGCDEYVFSKINVEFKVNSLGSKIEDSIRVKGRFEKSWDRCHDRPTVVEFIFDKI